MLLTTINHKARNWTLEKYGRPFPYCREGANRFVHLARKAGYTNGRIKRVGGFYNGNQHHWAVDTHTGWIYDPTQEQFRIDGFEAVIRKNNPRYTKYEAVDENWSHSGPSDNFSVYQSWRAYKKWKQNMGMSNSLQLSEKMYEVRTSKKGDRYAFFSRDVYCGHRDVGSTVLRCATVFASDNGGLNVGAIYQTFVWHEDTLKKPTRVRTYHITKDGRYLKKIRGRWTTVSDEEYLDLSALLAQGGKEV